MSDVERIGAAMDEQFAVENANLLIGTEYERSSLPEEYWPCPLCIVTLMEAHATGRIHHQRAFQALRNSGLVEDWPENEGMVQATERGRAFIQMLLATPLPEHRWIDPREAVKTAERS